MICQVVEDAINTYGVLRFQNECAISSTDFLEALKLYLRSTVVNFMDEPHIQKKGVCIGSCIVPLLSDLVLANFDRHLHASLSSLQVSVQKVFRYVDDFLIVLEQGHHDAPTQFQEVYAKFCEVLNVFTLTKEYPEKGSLRFLDLKLTCKQDHVCWEYAPRSKMGLLPFSSAHSKLIKRGVASAALGNALQRSCYHQVHTSFCSQVERLLSAGYPSPLLTGVAEKLLEKCAKLSPVKQPDGGRSSGTSKSDPDEENGPQDAVEKGGA
ncbi:hypothetical protein HPB49_009128 [Dermacentor silvarum]|uniref:Uncharacterized protein n=1 Tax=Dermacentor silvarum TaxID=543639 RepID=A0ACB8DXU8_DERSI|nr:hypothetical protein HPB49_009128 [Dermacentor silvarum]